MAVPSVTFTDGFKMPGIGLGTFLSKHEEAVEAVKYAIDVGYRHIDTATYYENEKEIGMAIREKIKDGTIKREDIFVTSKLWSNKHKEDHVVPTCKTSLENLGLNYIDLYLMHWPFAFKEGNDLLPKDESGKLLFSDTDYLETWRGMEECKRQGFVRSIGVSNFNSEQIARLLTHATIKPVNNQIETSVNINQEKLIEFCKKHNITVTGFAPFSRPGNKYGVKNSWDNPIIGALSQKYGKTLAQIACRYVFQSGAVPIPKSVTKSRIRENFEIFDFSLTDEEILSIRSIATGERVAAMKVAEDSKYFPFRIAF